MSNNKKIWILPAVLILLTAFALTGIAILRPARNSGTYNRDITDRVRFTVENTDFVFPKETSESGEAELIFTLHAKKTEADFYAVIHSIELTGLKYNSMTFQTVDSEINYIPENLALPAVRGEAVEVTWIVTVNFTPKAEPQDFELQIDYTAGITPTTADEHILSIPMHLDYD